MDELGKLMSQMGDKMTKQEAKDMIRLIDRNKDGCVEYKGVSQTTQAPVHISISNYPVDFRFRIFFNCDKKIASNSKAGINRVKPQGRKMAPKRDVSE